MRHRLLLITNSYVHRMIDPDDVEAELNRLGDWIRVNPLTWFLWTNRPTAEVGFTMRGVIHAGDSCVVVHVRPEAADGWAHGWMFDWLNRRMGEELAQSTVPPPPPPGPPPPGLLGMGKIK